MTQVSRRQSRRRSTVRASSIYDEDDTEKLPSTNCTFEVTRHSVDKLLMRCREQMESNPQSATDIVELISLVTKLSKAAFAARDDYEEECIKFHLAQKRIVDYPVKFQAEIDLMALGIRHANKAFLGKLKEEREVMVDKGAKCELECEKLFDTNRLLAKEKEISEKLMAALVDGLNQRMSAKAKTQIEIFKALNQIATATEKIDALPQRLEIFESNTDEDIKQFEFEISTQIDEIESNSNNSIEAGNKLNGLYAEYSQLNQVRVRQKVCIVKSCVYFYFVSISFFFFLFREKQNQKFFYKNFFFAEPRIKCARIILVYLNRATRPSGRE